MFMSASEQLPSNKRHSPPCISGRRSQLFCWNESTSDGVVLALIMPAASTLEAAGAEGGVRGLEVISVGSSGVEALRRPDFGSSRSGLLVNFRRPKRRGPCGVPESWRPRLDFRPLGKLVRHPALPEQEGLMAFTVNFVY